MSEATHNEPNLTNLAKQWLAAKAKEEAARKNRVKLEEQMLPFLEQKQEGSTTCKLETGHKVTVTIKLNRKLDVDTFNAMVRSQIPPELVPLKVEEKLDERGVKWLQEHRPDIYQLIAPHLTVTPAKPGIKVVAPIVDPEDA